MIPAWILDIFAALMLVVAGIGAGRLLAERPWAQSAPDADIDAAHVLMGIAMAGMLASGLKTLPNAVWVAVFAVITAWLCRQVGRAMRARAGRICPPSSPLTMSSLHPWRSDASLCRRHQPGCRRSSAMGGMAGMGGKHGNAQRADHRPGVRARSWPAGSWDIDQASKSAVVAPGRVTSPCPRDCDPG